MALCTAPACLCGAVVVVERGPSHPGTDRARPKGYEVLISYQRTAV
jgi:hypothetical protein